MSESRIEKWLEEWWEKEAPIGTVMLLERQEIVELLAKFERDHATPSPVEGNDLLIAQVRIALRFHEREGHAGAWDEPYRVVCEVIERLLSEPRPEPAASSPSDALREKVEALPTITPQIMKRISVAADFENNKYISRDAVLRLIDEKR
jgi:hypothetical protein